MTSWTDTAYTPVPGTNAEAEAEINEYYRERPAQVLGDVTVRPDPWGRFEVGVRGEHQPMQLRELVAEDLARVVENGRFFDQVHLDLREMEATAGQPFASDAITKIPPGLVTAPGPQ